MKKIKKKVKRRFPGLRRQYLYEAEEESRRRIAAGIEVPRIGRMKRKCKCGQFPRHIKMPGEQPYIFCKCGWQIEKTDPDQTDQQFRDEWDSKPLSTKEFWESISTDD